jgi:hypothetical protein
MPSSVAPLSLNSYVLSQPTTLQPTMLCAGSCSRPEDGVAIRAVRIHLTNLEVSTIRRCALQIILRRGVAVPLDNP